MANREGKGAIKRRRMRKVILRTLQIRLAPTTTHKVFCRSAPYRYADHIAQEGGHARKDESLMAQPQMGIVRAPICAFLYIEDGILQQVLLHMGCHAHGHGV